LSILSIDSRKKDDIIRDVMTNNKQTNKGTKMAITVTVNVGLDFGTSGKMVTETKVFDSIVDFNTYQNLLKEFDDSASIVSVAWDCK
jgi:hypothetical protein